MITVTSLKKQFRIQDRSHGRFAMMRDLFKPTYHMKTAVNDISFEIPDGEMMAYIGPNGSGKSTTIKMLCGILQPTSGSVTVNGIVPYKNRKQNSKQIGVVFGLRTQLWWDIPVSESLNLMKYIYKVPEAEFQRNMALFMDILGLGEFIDMPVRQLSLGQRMRADLCVSLLHDPKVLYLDEPTIGLDIVVKQRIRQFLRDINRERGTTILLTTHDISDIEQLCKRVIVIEGGAKKYEGTLDDLKHLYGRTETITVRLSEPLLDGSAIQKGGIESIRSESDELVISYDATLLNAMDILNRLSEFATVLHFKVEGTAIEDVIARIYQAQ